MPTAACERTPRRCFATSRSKRSKRRVNRTASRRSARCRIPKILSHIAKAATRASVAELALGRVDDARSRGSIARHAALESIRVAACASLTDSEELVAVALNSAFKDTAVAAVDRLTDRADLEQVAERSNNKNAVKRARAILRDMDERAAQNRRAVTAGVSTRSTTPPTRSIGARQLEAARLEEERGARGRSTGARRSRSRCRNGAPARRGVWRPSRQLAQDGRSRAIEKGSRAPA